MHDWLQYVIAAAILGIVLLGFYKHGAGNPESTGGLSRQMRKHEQRLAKVEENIQRCATRGSVDLLAEQVRSLEAHTASSGEVIALQGEINAVRMNVAALSNTLNEKIDGVAKTAERTEGAVFRLQDYFIERGVKGS